MRAALLICVSACTAALAQPVVPGGYSVTLISPVLDGQTPKLAAINDPAFGTGVVSATVGNGIATFRLIENSGLISLLGSAGGLEPSAFMIRVRHDADNAIDGFIHATVMVEPGGAARWVTVKPDTTTTYQFEVGTFGNSQYYDFDFLPPGQTFAAHLLDQNSNGGTTLSSIDAAFALTIQNQNSVPAGRIDTDAKGYQRDVTGLYGGGFLLADTDDDDQVSVIYSLSDIEAGGTYTPITPLIDWNTKRYGDLAIAASGEFGGVVYITETLNNEIQQVAPDGTHTTWASGFTGIDSLTISTDGEFMYVSDQSGVWLIRASAIQPGPLVLAHDPSSTVETPLCGQPVNTVRVIFSQPVFFDDTDISILDSNAQPVPFDASGSGSQYMFIGLGMPLRADTYTITIADTVVGAISGFPIDGDNDGQAGGAAVITLVHSCEADLASPAGILDLRDIMEFVNIFLNGCG